ncbi:MULTISPECIES: hypothetical protein [unclassified Saccharopolyspora]|uniref:hypothetical protein n=1 Tax=unclassified Saccharopolyspora TaxID=2646250 RepID=UPI001CD31E6D|nr:MULTISPECIES: hypothetical protein [unclassified Saccharopolyspora]MCA1194496.1 hypothetical protein [Saccharopolyspora sp. 6V]MCA1228716.1 hypothetical protein [Saccharopolyspora sp. 6M]
MAFHKIRGNAAGDLGENVVLDTSVHPPGVEHLHFAIDAWAGADLIGRFPVLLVTRRLADALESSGLAAFELRDAEITFEPEADEVRAEQGIDAFPEFQWLVVTGTAGQDDLGVTELARLVVSDRALDVLRQFNLEGCKIENYQD